jgi:ATP-dependent 26S proteasome regulatory subunit
MINLNFKQQFAQTIASGTGGIWVNSYEHLDALSAIREACQANGWQLAAWKPNELTEYQPDNKFRVSAGPAPVALKWLANQDQPYDENGQPQGRKERVILVVDNFTRYIAGSDGNITTPNQNELVQTIQDLIIRGDAERLHIVILGYPHVAVPAELKHMMRHIEHNLPDSDELRALLGKVVDDEQLPVKDSPEEQAVLGGVAGLSRLEAVQAFSECLTAHGKLIPDVLWERKADSLQVDGILKVLVSRDDAAKAVPASFDNIGGLGPLKTYLLQTFRGGRISDAVHPRGILLLGVQGAGKSRIAKSLGNALNRAVIQFDITACRDKYVGTSESRLRTTQNRLAQSGPCVVLLDELEKSVATDGEDGTGKRMMGSLLTWMADPPPNIYFVATANDISRLPPELFRPGRFDSIWFVDLPPADIRAEIWEIYEVFYGKHGLTPGDHPDDTNWTGAEIESCCVQAVLRGISLKEAGQSIVPVYKTAKERIDALRAWATDRCLSADYGGLYNASVVRDVGRPTTAARRRAIDKLF